MKRRTIDLATSYTLDFENSANPFEMRKTAIKEYTDNYSTVYVSAAKTKEVDEIAEEIKKTGIKKCLVEIALNIY